MSETDINIDATMYANGGNHIRIKNEYNGKYSIQIKKVGDRWSDDDTEDKYLDIELDADEMKELRKILKVFKDKK